MKNQKKILLFIFIFILLSFISLIIFRLKEKNNREETLKNAKPVVTAVSIIKPKKEALNNFFMANGSIITSESVDITSKVSGKIIKLYVKEGQKVSKNQKILDIETIDINNQILQTKAQVNAAKANLDLLINGSLKEQIKQSESSFEQQKINLEQLKLKLKLIQTDLDRNKKLFKDGAITKQQLDSIQNQVDTTKKEIEVVKQQINYSKETLKLTKIGNREEQIRGAKANYEQTLALLKTLTDQLTNYSINSPIDGVITKKPLEEGSIISPASLITNISKNSNLEAEINIPERYLDKVKIGNNLQIKLSDGFLLDTKITYISPTIDIGTNTFKIKSTLMNNEKIKQGMSFESKIIISEKKLSLTLPFEAIIDSEGKKIVYLISKENKAIEKEIKIGLQDTEKVEVISGLSENDKVILNGNNFIKTGDLVQEEKN
ncbi:MAG: efflux RND transporter periplasmic adaptor subunit [Candidatus Sericytochromatia bacterium]